MRKQDKLERWIKDYEQNRMSRRDIDLSLVIVMCMFVLASVSWWNGWAAEAEGLGYKAVAMLYDANNKKVGVLQGFPYSGLGITAVGFVFDVDGFSFPLFATDSHFFGTSIAYYTDSSWSGQVYVQSGGLMYNTVIQGAPKTLYVANPYEPEVQGDVLKYLKTGEETPCQSTSGSSVPGNGKGRPAVPIINLRDAFTPPFHVR